MLVIFCCAVVLHACTTATLTYNPLPDEEEEEYEKIFLRHKRLVYDCFKRYMDYSDFLDTSSYVTARSVEKFKNLFVDNAKVWNDYLWEPQLDYANYYADQVYYYHRVRGLKVKYEEGVLDQLYSLDQDQLLLNIDKSEPDDYKYKYSFQVKKGVYYILNKEKKVIYFDEPIEYYLDFIFYISSDDDRAEILDILPVGSKKN